MFQDWRSSYKPSRVFASCVALSAINGQVKAPLPTQQLQADQSVQTTTSQLSDLQFITVEFSLPSDIRVFFPQEQDFL